MNALVLAYHRYLEERMKNPDGYHPPISLQRLSRSGLADNQIVVYLRFVDLIRSAAIICNTTFLIRGVENLNASCNSFGRDVMNDYIAFISDLTGLVIKTDTNVFALLSEGLRRITYSRDAQHYPSFDRLFLSFDDFRANLDLITADLILGHWFGYEIEFLSEEKLSKLTDQELSERIIEAETYITEHKDMEESIPECLSLESHQDAISSARLISTWTEISDKVEEYQDQLELFQHELDRRTRKKTENAVPSLYIKQDEKSNADLPVIKWKKQPERAYCKCMFPSCSDNSYRKGYCWYHYQQEYYLSK